MTISIMLFTIVMACGIYFLFQSKRNYTTASQITQQTIQELNKMEGKTRLFVDSLPQECNGAVIFRLGFYEAVQWMKPLPAFKNIFVASPLPNIKKSREEYQVIYKDSSFLRSNQSTEKDFNSLTDVVFIYTDTALIVVK